MPDVSAGGACALCAVRGQPGPPQRIPAAAGGGPAGVRRKKSRAVAGEYGGRRRPAIRIILASGKGGAQSVGDGAYGGQLHRAPDKRGRSLPAHASGHPRSQAEHLSGFLHSGHGQAGAVVHRRAARRDAAGRGRAGTGGRAGRKIFLAHGLQPAEKEGGSHGPVHPAPAFSSVFAHQSAEPPKNSGGGWDHWIHGRNEHKAGASARGQSPPPGDGHAFHRARSHRGATAGDVSGRLVVRHQRAARAGRRSAGSSGGLPVPGGHRRAGCAS